MIQELRHYWTQMIQNWILPLNLMYTLTPIDLESFHKLAQNNLKYMNTLFLHDYDWAGYSSLKNTGLEIFINLCSQPAAVVAAPILVRRYWGGRFWVITVKSITHSAVTLWQFSSKPAICQMLHAWHQCCCRTICIYSLLLWSWRHTTKVWQNWHTSCIVTLFVCVLTFPCQLKLCCIMSFAPPQSWGDVPVSVFYSLTVDTCTDGGDVP